MKHTLKNWFAALLLAVPMSAAVASGGGHYEKSRLTCATKSACSAVLKFLPTTAYPATRQAVCASTV